MSNKKFKMLTEVKLNHWEKQDLWNLKELSELCNGLDPDAITIDKHGKSSVLKQTDELIERAMHAEVLPKIDYKRRKRLIEPHLKISDYHFKPTDAIRWATGRFPKFPEFEKQEDDDSRLTKSEYWNNFEKMVKQAIREYPAWRAKQHKVKKSDNLQGWLTRKVDGIGADTRQAVIIGHVLTELFNIP